MKKIMVLGDVHGEWRCLNQLMNKKRPDIVLQCGDFGYWPNLEDRRRLQYKERYGKALPSPKVPENTTLYWCDGNHEDHWSLADRETDELWPRIIYKPRGSVLTLPDGRNVLFMGGATSVDKESRSLGFDWFPQECINQDDVLRLPPDLRVDIVISHTCPREFDLEIGHKDEGYFRDFSRMALSYVLTKYRPALWYFGHWHVYSTGFTQGCRWTALSRDGRTGWWEYIKGV